MQPPRQNDPHPRLGHLLVAGAGYLGLEVAYQAAEDWHLTTVNRRGELATHAADLTSERDLLTLKNDIPPVDVVIHCASSGRRGADIYRAIFVESTRLFRRIFPEAHLILCSSTSVYHQIDGSEADENSPTHPSSETSQFLLEAEQNAHCAARLAGLYGPQRSVILQRFLKGEALIEDDGRRLLNQIHRDDAARALLLLAKQRATGVFNVCDGQSLSQLQTYQQLGELLSRPLPPYGSIPQNRKRAWTHKKVLNDKLRHLGWAPHYPSFISAVPELLKNDAE